MRLALTTLFVLVLCTACGETMHVGHDSPDAAAGAAQAGDEHAGHDHAADPKASTSAGAEATAFGKAPAADAETTTVGAIYAAPDAFLGKTVVVSSEIKDVCQKAGCWAVLAEGEHAMRVKITDHSWALPKDCAGKSAVFEGKIIDGAVSKKVAKHYAGESQKPDAMPEKYW